MIDEHTRKTSEYWSRESSHVKILKHDGWCTESYKAFYYSWFEKPVIEREFFKRLSNSTIRIKS